MLKNIGMKASHFTAGETEAQGGYEQFPGAWLIRTLSHLSGQGSGRGAWARAGCRESVAETQTWSPLRGWSGLPG